MKIGAKRFLSLMLCCIMVLGLFSVTAFAVETVKIKKVWEDNGFQVEHPETVSIDLLNDDGEVIENVTLYANNNWTGSFQVNGVADIVEVPIDNYNVSYTKPGKEHISVGNWGEKVTPANQTSFTLQGGNIVVAKKGGEYYIWTNRESELTDTQKSKVIEAINNANLGGLGKTLSSTNTEFKSGLPAEFTGSEVKIEPAESNTVNIIFKKQKAWSLFYEGTLTIEDAPGWIVTNTYIPETVDISVTKVWDHKENKETPTSVQVQLYADEEILGDPVTLQSNIDESKNWKVTFEDLPKYYNDGIEIIYSVQEVNVPTDYTPSVTGNAKEGFTITNTYTSTNTSESESESGSESGSGSGSGSNPGSKPESNPIRDTVTIEIGNNEKPEEANPDTGAPLMFVPVMAAALAAAVVVKRKK